MICNAFFSIFGAFPFSLSFPFFPKDIYYLLCLWITLTVKNFKGRYATLARLGANPKPQSLFKLRSEKIQTALFSEIAEIPNTAKNPVQGNGGGMNRMATLICKTGQPQQPSFAKTISRESNPVSFNAKTQI
jgi:hypothetical protein